VPLVNSGNEVLARAGRAHAPRPRSGRRAPSPDGQVSAEMVGEGLSWGLSSGAFAVTPGSSVVHPASGSAFLGRP